jgi:hypothetical protein
MRVYITGSNAEMLSHEIASVLGGRFINKEILPLSFSEFLNFQGIAHSDQSKYNNERFAIKKAYELYLRFGAFPELIQLDNKREFLSNVYQKLFYGDLISRYQISNPQILKLLLKKLAESVNNETSVNRIKNLIKSTGISIGNNTLFDYLSYLEFSFMIASISNYYSKFVEKESTPADFGVIELLWNIFGGTVNEQGFKVLDPHIGAIYGDSITLDRQIQIYERLAAKGFASTNIVLGVGSYTYQMNTRDTLGFAAKGAWFEVEENGVKTGYDIFKDPVTDNGTKKSLKGLICVTKDHDGEYIVNTQCTPEMEAAGVLQTIYEDGKFYNQTSLTAIRSAIETLI